MAFFRVAALVPVQLLCTEMYLLTAASSVTDDLTENVKWGSKNIQIALCMRRQYVHGLLKKQREAQMINERVTKYWHTDFKFYRAVRIWAEKRSTILITANFVNLFFIRHQKNHRSPLTDCDEAIFSKFPANELSSPAFPYKGLIIMGDKGLCLSPSSYRRWSRSSDKAAIADSDL